MLIGDLPRLAAALAPDKAAILCRGRRMSFAALDRDAERFARALIDAGLGKGDRAAILCRNLAEYAVVHFGCARAGVVLVHLIVAYGPDELIHMLNATAARLIVVEEPSAARIKDLRDRLPALAHMVVIGGKAGAGAVTLDGFIAASPTAASLPVLHETEPFGITFTGGTTGRPKGAVVNHRARLISCSIAVVEHDLREDDVLGLVSPLFHAIAGMVLLPAAVLRRTTVSLLPEWDAEAFMRMVARDRITVALLVPTQLRRVLHHADFTPQRLAHLRIIACGAAAMPPELLAELRRVLPETEFIDNYGQTETGPLAFLNSRHLPDKAGTVGRPAIGIDLEIVDDRGRPVPRGTAGEIVTSGDHLMDGYLDDPQATAEFFRGNDGRGWTGDLAVMDEDGFITLVGRAREMIVSGGENIYPREVELVLERHQAVAECAVVGIPHDEWGESIAAFIVLRPGASLDAAAARAHCAAHLARFKRPSAVRFVDALPMTPAGKVKKPVLRARYLAEGG
jgi:acyl-CoA synthetase (AMP-forming)/AMP-acid ligase II